MHKSPLWQSSHLAAYIFHKHSHSLALALKSCFYWLVLGADLQALRDFVGNSTMTLVAHRDDENVFWDSRDGPQASGFASLLWPPGSSESNQCPTTYNMNRPFDMMHHKDNFRINSSFPPCFPITQSFLGYFSFCSVLCTVSSHPWWMGREINKCYKSETGQETGPLTPSPFPTFDVGPSEEGESLW